eukprot:g7487.t1
MWRRVRGGGRAPGERFSTAPSAEPKAPEAPEAPSANTDTAQSRGRKITFNYVVRVVLVPCTKDLRPLNPQLWWGADDYLDFRRDFILASRSAAAAAASKRDEEQQPPLPSHASAPSASARSDTASAVLHADEPTIARGAKVVANLLPPSPTSPLSLTNLAISLPSTNPGATEAAIPGVPAATVKAGTSGGHEQQEVPDGHALSTSSTPRKEPYRKTLSRTPRLNESVLSFSPSRPCAISTTKKWTPSAGMMAAKAAAEAEEEGYRTESMSSASDSSLSSEYGGETDSDVDPP